MSNTKTLRNEEARPEMDDLLQRYFHAEMPHPWPAFQAPTSMRTQTRASLWSRSAGRLALAGSVAVLVIGYLTLGTFFPRLQPRTDFENAARDIGKGHDNPKSKKAPILNQPDDTMPPLMP